MADEQNFDGENPVPGYTLFHGKDGKSYYLKGENLADDDITQRVSKLRGSSAPSGNNSAQLQQAPGTGEPSLGQRALGVGSDLLQGVGEGALQTVNTISKGLNKIPYIGEALAPRQGIDALSRIATPDNLTQRIGAAGEQVGETMAAGPLRAGLTKIAGARLPLLGRYALPAARIGTEALTSGLSAGLHDQPITASAALGAGGQTVSEGLNAIAPAIAESALGVTQRMRGRGRTIGQAVLDNTTGVRPGTVAEQSQQAIQNITQQMENNVNAASQSGVVGTTQDAHTVLNDAISKMPRNARSVIGKMNELHDLLDLRPTGSVGPVPTSFTPTEILEMKRGIGKEIATWPPEWQQLGDVQQVKQRLYGALDNQLDKLVPGNAELNQKISSLIPGAQRALARSDSAELPQRIAGRLAAHTGALAGAGIGSALGYGEGGKAGALAGGLAGLVIPELVTSPTAQMTAARIAATRRALLPSLRPVLMQKESDEN